MLDKFFHDVFDNNFDGILVITEDFRIKHMNKTAEKITGFTESESKNKFCYEILRAKCCKDKCLIKSIDKKKGPGEFIVDIIAKNGKKKYIKVKIIHTHGLWVEIFNNLFNPVIA